MIWWSCYEVGYGQSMKLYEIDHVDVLESQYRTWTMQDSK